MADQSSEQAFVQWREYDIHKGGIGEEKNNDFDAGNVDDGPADDEECYNGGIDLFETSKPSLKLEDFSFRVPGYGGGVIESDNVVVKLKAQSDYTHSTGMAVWGGSIVLAQFLAEGKKMSDISSSLARIEDHHFVLELGAGVGLCGILAHRLGARKVCVTDGDLQVLENLRENVRLNQLTISSNGNDPGHSTISCHQLIWGQRDSLDAFKARHGRADVILASDLFYITKSLEPLWRTVRHLLKPPSREGIDEKDSGGMFIAVNVCATQEDSLEPILNMAREFGFYWTTYQQQVFTNYDDAITNDPSGVTGKDDANDRKKETDVYVFRQVKKPP